MIKSIKHNIRDIFQSGFQLYHSPKTALIKILNDTEHDRAMIEGTWPVAVLLDPSKYLYIQEVMGWAYVAQIKLRGQRL